MVERRGVGGKVEHKRRFQVGRQGYFVSTLKTQKFDWLEHLLEMDFCMCLLDGNRETAIPYGSGLPRIGCSRVIYGRNCWQS